MKPYDRLTIIPNRYRSSSLRAFRELVALYFDRAELDEDGIPMDRDGARTVRSRINQMLPRVVESIRAAGLGDQAASRRAHGRIDLLERIFTTPPSQALAQDLFDVIDMASGVYDGDRIFALGRTVSPFHYLVKALGFIAGIPRAGLGALGFRRRTPLSTLQPNDIARLEAAVARLADIEGLIDSRFAELQDRQAQNSGEQHRQLVELAERMDFAERLLVDARAPKEIAPPEKRRVITPV